MGRKTIIECVAQYANATSNKIAVIDHGRKTTYTELFTYVLGYRAYLRQQGICKGSIVVQRAGQNLEYVVRYLSTHSIGGVVAALEKNTSSENMIRVADQLQADFILEDHRLPNANCSANIIAEGDVLRIASDWIGKADPKIEDGPAADDLADILFTTGTTGASKGVALTHNALTATAENLIFGCQYRPDTVILVPGPLNHANAIRKLFTTLINGSTIHLLDGMLNLKAFFDALDHDEGTIACCLPPSAIRTLFQLTKDQLGNYADKIDFIESATAPLPEPDKLKLCELLPNTRLYNNYGSSESASVCMYDYNTDRGKIGCIGRPLPNAEILIVDDKKQPIHSSANHTGLIACKGDMNMTSYINAPELTSKVLVDGVVYTNDIGYMDEEGYVYIVGRQGDVINVGGLKVAPAEVESAALSYDGVEDCICLGVDDKVTGKALKLLMVMRGDTEFNPKKIRSYLATKLESHQVPRYYEQVDAVKKTYNGKLDRKAYS